MQFNKFYILAFSTALSGQLRLTEKINNDYKQFNVPENIFSLQL